MIRNRLACLFAISLIVVLAGVASAQVTTGTISGTVADPNGAVVLGADVKATNLDTNSARSASSDSDGHFAFTLLPPGRYHVEVNAPGFQAYQAETVVNITQTTSLDVRLGLTGAIASVMVNPLV